MEIEVEKVEEEPTVSGEAIVSLLESELELAEVILVTISLTVGFLYGGITGFILVLSPAYISKRSYGLLLGLVLLVVMGEHIALALTVLADALYILVRTFGAWRQPDQRLLVVPYKIINVNAPLLI